MSKTLTAQQQHALLSRFPWTPEGRVKVTALRKTEPLLKYAGFRNPKPFAEYELDVKYIAPGLLVLRRHPGAAMPGACPPADHSESEVVSEKLSEFAVEPSPIAKFTRVNPDEPRPAA
jgi:hypothetical protein